MLTEFHFTIAFVSEYLCAINSHDLIWFNISSVRFMRNTNQIYKFKLLVMMVLFEYIVHLSLQTSFLVSTRLCPFFWGLSSREESGQRERGV